MRQNILKQRYIFFFILNPSTRVLALQTLQSPLNCRDVKLQTVMTQKIGEN
jgi:hypothetical protein